MKDATKRKASLVPMLVLLMGMVPVPIYESTDVPKKEDSSSSQSTGTVTVSTRQSTGGNLLTTGTSLHTVLISLMMTLGSVVAMAYMKKCHDAD